MYLIELIKLKIPPRMPTTMACMHRIFITKLRGLKKYYVKKTCKAIFVQIHLLEIIVNLAFLFPQNHVKDGRKDKSEAGNKHRTNQLQINTIVILIS